jgi:hypothetical protein
MSIIPIVLLCVCVALLGAVASKPIGWFAAALSLVALVFYLLSLR